MHGAGGLDAQLFEALPQPALACDESGRILRCNPAARRQIGHDAADLGDQALAQLGADPLARQALEVALGTALREGTAGCDDLPLARAAGRPGPWRADVRLVRLPAGSGPAAPGCLVLLSEPADRADGAIEALLAEKEAAVAASQAKSRFLSRMSHELRTPLNAVLGFTQLMRAEVEAADAQPEIQLAQLDFIEQAGWQLLTMIDNVLDLARIETGRLELHPERLAVAPALEEALSLIDASARRRHLQIEVFLADALPEVHADRARLRQVLLVLLSNAVKFNADHGRVTVRVRAEPGFVQMDVSDAGPGLDPAGRQALFETLDRLGASTDADGTGVSLSIARQLVLAMGGRFQLDSAIGQGATFSVSLPLADAEPAAGSGGAS
jgi:signal transduction histidine kinase